MESLPVAEVLLAGRSDWLDEPGVSALAEHPLGSVETEYPHYVGAVEDPEGPEPPRERHPVSYGCFDWHSAVHSHWSLVRQLRLFDDHPRESAIERSIDSRLTSENVEREVASELENADVTAVIAPGSVRVSVAAATP